MIDFFTKFAPKGYFQSKRWKMNITITIKIKCVRGFILKSFDFLRNLPKKGIFNSKQKQWTIELSIFELFESPSFILNNLNFSAKFAQKRILVKNRKVNTNIEFSIFELTYSWVPNNRPPRLLIFLFFSAQDIFIPTPPIINFQSFLFTFLSVNSHFYHSPS